MEIDISTVTDLAERGCTITEIAEKIGCKYNSVYRVCQRNKIDVRQNRRPPVDSEKLCDQFEAGASIAQLAAWHSTTQATVRYHLRKGGLLGKSRQHYTEDDNAKIITAIESLARELGRTPAQIAGRCHQLYFGTATPGD